MQDTLGTRVFRRELLDDVKDFYCGDEPWSKAQAQWIKEDAIQALETSKWPLEVWLYYNSKKELVGYSSLGKTSRRYPNQEHDHVYLSIIPHLAIQYHFRGKPDEGKRYSHQIMEDLLFKANKAKKKNKYQILILDVHEENERAISFYKKYDFHQLDEKNENHLKFAHHLKGMELED